MPEPKDHYAKRGVIESVLRHIPGFRGYLEKEYRRESDQLQRDWLAERLQKSKRAVDEASRDLAEAANLDALPQFDRLRGKLDKLIGRIRGAMEGYSGFFDLVQIDEAVLDRVYEHDVKIMDEVEDVAEQVERLPAASDVGTAVGDVIGCVDELEQAWEVRVDILRGLE